VYLMKVFIWLSNLLTLSIPDEGVYLTSNLLTLSIPDEGVSRNMLWPLN
jgi:hypothetical protein